MEKSESIMKLAEALSKAQGMIKGAVKDSDNPFFHSSYADLASVWEACRVPLSINGLSVVQTTEIGDSKTILITILLHNSGEYISGRYPITPMRQAKDVGWTPSDDPQSLGSAITYARRYAMSAIVGIAPEDDDGEAAMGRDKKQAEKKPKPQDAPQDTISREYVLVDDITSKTGVNDKTKKPWTAYSIHIGELKYGTFDKKFMEMAVVAKDQGHKVKIESKDTKFGKEIVSMQTEEPDMPEPGEDAQ